MGVQAREQGLVSPEGGWLGESGEAREEGALASLGGGPDLSK